MVISPVVLAPSINFSYGVDSSAFINTNSATGGVYRVAQWSTTTSDTSTYPTSWDSGTANTTTTGGIQFRTLGSPYTQWAQGPSYTIRYYNGTNDTYWNTIGYSYNVYLRKSAAERLREILNSRMAPGILTNCKPLGLTNDMREVRARETLKRVLGEDRFRDFVRRGSVSVRAKSGLVYQIFPGSDFTKVYDCGKLIDRLCVVLNGGFPPTDSLIMRYLMILNNEQQFRGYAIKHGVYTTPAQRQADQRTLAEIFKELKKVA